MILRNAKFLLTVLAAIILVACNKNKVNNTNIISSEHNTEKTNKNNLESQTSEAALETFDIKEHPELWSMDDRDTYLLVLDVILDPSKTIEYNNCNEKLPLTIQYKDNHKDIFQLLGGGINRGDDWERYEYINATEEEYNQHLFWCHTLSDSLSRQALLRFKLDSKNNIDDIEVVNVEIVKDIYENEEKSQPKSFINLDRLGWTISCLIYAPLDENQGWKDDGTGLYNCNGYTDNFLSKFDPEKGLVAFADVPNMLDVFSDLYLCGATENNEFSDLNNNCMGVDVKLCDRTKDDKIFKRHCKIYFEVDNRNFLDSITKVEEVLEDGTTVEIENNFGK